MPDLMNYRYTSELCSMPKNSNGDANEANTWVDTYWNKLWPYMQKKKKKLKLHGFTFEGLGKGQIAVFSPSGSYALG